MNLMFPLRQLKHLLPLLLPAVCCCLGVLASCMDDEGYTLSPDARLEFSTDTVAFDTVISGRPTNTYTFMVYNRNDEAVRLARVGLEKGSESPFRVNVDGTYLTGGSGTDFEIAANDSMRVFLEMTAAEHDSDTPVETIDKLLFRLQNGVQQHVTLTAYGQDVVELDGVVLSRDTLLSARRPYHVLDSLVVARGVTLT
ncbi:MAG: right-handed parallel beta-helix repeat-containing protein, partial [Bacteroidaceae bacterium]|nr:right-handed parallel beta-helix repeat-containing protein [Bacteroidaceae bacterium]